MLTDGHSIDCTYLQHSFEDIFEGQAQIKVFREHRIDWEGAKLIPHGPDITGGGWLEARVGSQDWNLPNATNGLQAADGGGGKPRRALVPGISRRK